MVKVDCRKELDYVAGVLQLLYSVQTLVTLVSSAHNRELCSVLDLIFTRLAAGDDVTISIHAANLLNIVWKRATIRHDACSFFARLLYVIRSELGPNEQLQVDHLFTYYIQVPCKTKGCKSSIDKLRYIEPVEGEGDSCWSKCSCGRRVKCMITRYPLIRAVAPTSAKHPTIVWGDKLRTEVMGFVMGKREDRAAVAIRAHGRYFFYGSEFEAHIERQPDDKRNGKNAWEKALEEDSTLLVYLNTELDPLLPTISATYDPRDPVKCKVPEDVRRIIHNNSIVLCPWRNIFSTCGVGSSMNLMAQIPKKAMDTFLAVEGPPRILASTVGVFLKDAKEYPDLSKAVRPHGSCTEMLYLRGVLEAKGERGWSGSYPQKIIHSLMAEYLSESLVSKFMHYEMDIAVSLKRLIALTKENKTVLVKIKASPEMFLEAMKGFGGMASVIIECEIEGVSHAVLVIRTPQDELIRYDNGDLAKLQSLNDPKLATKPLSNGFSPVCTVALLVKQEKKEVLEMRRASPFRSPDNNIFRSPSPSPIRLRSPAAPAPPAPLARIFNIDRMAVGEVLVVPGKDDGGKLKIVYTKGCGIASKNGDLQLKKLTNNTILLTQTGGRKLSLLLEKTENGFACEKRGARSNNRSCRKKTAVLTSIFDLNDFHELTNVHHPSCFHGTKPKKNNT